MEKGEFRVGEALGRGFAIWFKNLPSFLVLAILVYSPIIVYTALVTSGAVLDDAEKLETYNAVTVLMQFALNLIVTAAVLYGTIQQLSGRHAGIGESIGVGLKRLFPVLGVGILSGLAVAVWFLILLVPGVGPFLAILAIVPALIMMCLLYAAVPAAVVERPGLFGALRRSRELTSGCKGQIFGILLVLGVLSIIISYLLKSIFVSDSMTDHDMKLFIWIGLAVDIALAALSATINGVVYHDLRVAKEGVGTEDLARVFE